MALAKMSHTLKKRNKKKKGVRPKKAEAKKE